MPTIQLNIQRFTPDEDIFPHFENHDFTVGERASVLDLAFRFSCRVGMCGSCAMVVNGRERLACSALIAPPGPRVRIEPLRNLPALRDLVVDLAPFFEAYERVLQHFVPAQVEMVQSNVSTDSFHIIPHDSAEWRAMDHQPQCIDCGACYSACSLVTLNPRYLGPMALHHALQLIADPRDAAHNERLQIVAGEAGSFRCHTLGNCRSIYATCSPHPN